MRIETHDAGIRNEIRKGVYVVEQRLSGAIVDKKLDTPDVYFRFLNDPLDGLHDLGRRPEPLYLETLFYCLNNAKFPGLALGSPRRSTSQTSAGQRLKSSPFG